MNILLIGATSSIVHEVGRIYASRGDSLFLVGRNEDKLSIVENDLRSRGAEQVTLYPLVDFTDPTAVKACMDSIVAKCGAIDVLIVGHGTLPDQQQAGVSYQQFLDQFEVNFLSVVSVLYAVKEGFMEQGHGTIAVIASVAGDRGRKSNYAYGTAKGALDIFLQGLRNELFSSGVSVLTVKPGFVDTPMTADIPKGKLFAAPEVVARDIVKGVERKKDVLYTPWFWRYLMSIICSIPEKIFKRLSL